MSQKPDSIDRFAVTFSYPYMETADTPGHVYLGGKLGFIYGSISFLAIIFGFLFIPETKRMELEDIDKQFAIPSDNDLKIAENQTDGEITINEVLKWERLDGCLAMQTGQHTHTHTHCLSGVENGLDEAVRMPC